jgi:hypothetical protein
MVVDAEQPQVAPGSLEQRCCRCGYRSGISSFFRRERARFPGRWKSFCRGCAPYRPSPTEVLSNFSGVLILLGAAAIAFKEASALGAFLVVLGMMFPGSFVGMVVHEAGHAGIARALGMRVPKVVIGAGPLLSMFRVLDTRIELRRFAGVAGITQFYDPSACPAKWRHALVLLGGAAGNVTLAGLGAVGAASWPVEPFVVLAAIAVIGTQLWLAAWNLTPRDVRIGRVVMPSDGRLLIRLFKEPNYGGNGGVALRAVEEGKALLAAAVARRRGVTSIRRAAVFRSRVLCCSLSSTSWQGPGGTMP